MRSLFQRYYDVYYDFCDSECQQSAFLVPKRVLNVQLLTLVSTWTQMRSCYCDHKIIHKLPKFIYKSAAFLPK
jgi:hypothetical protein